MLARKRDQRIGFSRNDAVVLAATFAAGLILRFGHLARVRGAPFFERLYLDPLYYDEWGRRIASGDILGDAVFFQDPLYPYFLGLLYALFGHRHLVVLSIQAVLGSMVAPMVFLAARRHLRRTAAVVASALAAVYLPSVYYDGLVLKTWMGTFLVAVLVLLLSRAVPGREMRPWLLAGLACGLACLARGNLVLLVPVVAAWVLLDRSATEPEAPPARGARSVESWRDRRVWASAGCWLLGAGLILGVTAVRNRVVAGWWAVSTANAGQNFYIGNNAANTTGQYEVPAFVDPNPKHEQRDFQREADRRNGAPVPPEGVSAFWFRESFDWIRSEPGRWLALVLRKVRVYFGSYEVPDNLDFYLYREYSGVLRLPLPGFGLLAPLGLLGGVLLARRGGWPRGLLVLLATYSASVIAFFVFSRFRVAMVPVWCVLAGHAVDQSVRSLRAWRAGSVPTRRVAAGALVLLASLAFVNLPVRAPESVWTVRLASALGLPTRPATTAAAHANLGLAYAIEAKDVAEPEALLRRAEGELRESLRQDPSIAKIHAELGKVLGRLGRDREAIGAFEEAARLEPGNWRTHHTLGLLHRRKGDLPAAIEAFGRSVHLQPRHAGGWTALGEALLEAGRPLDARAAFERALALSPSSPRARRGHERASRAANATSPGAPRP